MIIHIFVNRWDRQIGNCWVHSFFFNLAPAQ
uniref:Uncharacterized protein n=1 Tax=Arundo donax TaxID=35708 RepID=A0A0A8ZV42_ARUDO